MSPQDSVAPFDGLDRFARTPKIRDGGVVRARKLRTDLTHAEAKLWKRLRLFDVRIRRQTSIGPYVVDFACHSAKLVIETDIDAVVADITRAVGVSSPPTSARASTPSQPFPLEGKG